MEIIFNNEYSYPITYARQSFDTASGEGLYITFNYS